MFGRLSLRLRCGCYTMIATPEIEHFTAAGPSDAERTDQYARWAGLLRESFGVAFTLWDAESGELAYASLEQPGCNDPLRGQLARALPGGAPEFLADEGGLVVLGIPLALRHGAGVVATATFATGRLSPGERPGSAAGLLAIDESAAARWIEDQPVWTPDALVRLAAATQARLAAELRQVQLEHEVEKLSDNLASTYEEICLLHGVTQNLRIAATKKRCAGWCSAGCSTACPLKRRRFSSCRSPRKGRSPTRPAPRASC